MVVCHRFMTDDGLTEWHPAFLSMGQNLDACQQRYQHFCQRYSPKKKEARRVCSWGSRLFPHNLPKNIRRIFPSQTDLFEKFEKGCQVTKPDLAEFCPEFDLRAAVFTTANA